MKIKKKKWIGIFVFLIFFARPPITLLEWIRWRSAYVNMQCLSLLCKFYESSTLATHIIHTDKTRCGKKIQNEWTRKKNNSKIRITSRNQIKWSKKVYIRRKRKNKKKCSQLKKKEWKENKENIKQNARKRIRFYLIHKWKENRYNNKSNNNFMKKMERNRIKTQRKRKVEGKVSVLLKTLALKVDKKA